MVEHSSAGASGPLISGSDAPNRIPRPKNRSRVVRIMSPPALPPCWGQDVAPPPTPLFTPQTSPGSAAMNAESQMEGFFNAEQQNQLRLPPHHHPAVPSLLRHHHHHHDFGTLHSLDDRRQIRRQRRLRRVRSSSSSSSLLSQRHLHVLEEENFDPIFQLQRQPNTIVYAYSFDGETIDRRPLHVPQTSMSSTTSRLAESLTSQHHTRSAADVIHGFHHPPPFQDVLRHHHDDRRFASDFHLNRNHRDDRSTSLTRRRLKLLRHRSRPQNDSLVVEYHRSPPHKSLSSSPQGGATTTTTTGSGSVSPDVSPIVNIGENVTRLTTSPATPPSRPYDDETVISRAVMTSSRIATRSAMRRTSSTLSSVKPKTKTVQWFADLKRKPEEISDDRKVVKSQVVETRDVIDAVGIF